MDEGGGEGIGWAGKAGREATEGGPLSVDLWSLFLSPYPMVDEGGGEGTVPVWCYPSRSSMVRQAEEEGPGRGVPALLTHGTSSNLWTREW